MLKNKIEQSAAQSCLGTFELRVLPFGKTSGIKVLNLLNKPTDRTFENRHVGCKEREKINRRRTLCTLRINFFEATPQTACIFSKENYRYDANGYITAEKDGPFSEDEEFIFTYNYDKESGVYSTDYGFGLDAPKETEQTNPQDLFLQAELYME